MNLNPSIYTNTYVFNASLIRLLAELMISLFRISVDMTTGVVS